MSKKFRTHDLRKGRVSIPGQIYLVTTVTQDRKSVFTDLPVGRVVVHEIMRQGKFEWTETLAFVVMPDHVHWLLSLSRDVLLSNVVGMMKQHSARKINQLAGTQGLPAWQRGFHDHALRGDEDIIHVARYIVANPLRAGLVTNICDYPLWDVA